MSKRGGFPVGFRCVRTSRIAGPFHGYAPGLIHRLDDGSVWLQKTDRTEIVSADQPRAWLSTEGNVCYLDVDGTHGVVEVSACVDPDLPTTPGLTSGHLLGG